MWSYLFQKTKGLVVFTQTVSLLWNQKVMFVPSLISRYSTRVWAWKLQMELVSGGRFLGISGYQSCLPAHADLSTSPKVSAIRSGGPQLPVCGPAIWPAHSSDCSPRFWPWFWGLVRIYMPLQLICLEVIINQGHSNISLQRSWICQICTVQSYMRVHVLHAQLCREPMHFLYFVIFLYFSTSFTFIKLVFHLTSPWYDSIGQVADTLYGDVRDLFDP